MILGTLFDDFGYPEGSFWRFLGTWGSLGFRGGLRSGFRVDLRNERVLQNGHFWHP